MQGGGVRAKSERAGRLRLSPSLLLRESDGAAPRGVLLFCATGQVGVPTMRAGEICVLRCRHDYAYGVRGDPPDIPARATLDFVVRMVSCGGLTPAARKEQARLDSEAERLAAMRLEREQAAKEREEAKRKKEAAKAAVAERLANKGKKGGKGGKGSKKQREKEEKERKAKEAAAKAAAAAEEPEDDGDAPGSFFATRPRATAAEEEEQAQAGGSEKAKGDETLPLEAAKLTTALLAVSNSREALAAALAACKAPGGLGCDHPKAAAALLRALSRWAQSPPEGVSPTSLAAVVKALYDHDGLDEDAILAFVDAQADDSEVGRMLRPLATWLREADEESDEDEDEDEGGWEALAG